MHHDTAMIIVDPLTSVRRLFFFAENKRGPLKVRNVNAYVYTYRIDPHVHTSTFPD